MEGARAAFRNTENKENKDRMIENKKETKLDV